MRYRPASGRRTAILADTYAYSTFSLPRNRLLAGRLASRCLHPCPPLCSAATPLARPPHAAISRRRGRRAVSILCRGRKRSRAPFSLPSSLDAPPRTARWCEPCRPDSVMATLRCRTATVRYSTLYYYSGGGSFPRTRFSFPTRRPPVWRRARPSLPSARGGGVHTRDGARPLPWGPGGQHRLACSRLPDRRLRSQRGGSEDITFCTDSVALDGTCSTQYSTIYSHTHTHTFALFWCMPARRPAPAPVLWCLAQCKQHHSTGTTK